MGYTHYWRMDAPLKITETQRKLIDEIITEYRPILSGWDGTGELEFTKDILSFNGIGPDDDHETFRVEFGKQEEFSFCKTAQKPYDEPVMKVLLVLALSKGFNFSSDGEVNAGGEWEEALQWFCKKGFADTLKKKIYPYLKDR